MRSSILFYAALFVCACSGADRDVSIEREDALEEGRRLAPNEYGAVGVVAGAHGEQCTATLIAPQVVLTAQHCGTIVEFCPHDAPDDRCYEAEWTATPRERWLGFNTCPGGADIEVVRLREPVRGITPIAVSRAAVQPGATCTAIGLGVHAVGEHGASTLGEARAGTMTVLEVRDLSLFGRGASGFTTQGDSGGPVVCNGGVAAITSCGDYGSRDGWYTRVAPFFELIDAALRGERLERLQTPTAPSASSSGPPPGPPPPVPTGSGSAAPPPPPPPGTQCTAGAAKCEHGARDALYTCQNGFWALARTCPSGHCFAETSANGNLSRTGCPD